MNLRSADPNTNFAELGLDSLTLTQCANLVSKRMNTQVTFRKLAEELSTLQKLADHLTDVLPDSDDRVSQRWSWTEPSPPPQLASQEPAEPAPAALRQMEQKLELIAQQLEGLQRLIQRQTMPAPRDPGTPPKLDASLPPVPGARLGRDRDGNPAWFVPSPENPRKFVKLA